MHVSDGGDHGLTAWKIYLQMHAGVKDMISITVTCLACVQRCLKGYSCIPQIESNNAIHNQLCSIHSALQRSMEHALQLYVPQCDP